MTWSVILLLAAVCLPAQSLTNLLIGKSPSSVAQSPADLLGRSTPQSAVLNFLEACHEQRYVLASEYLDLRKIPADERRVEGPELARDLADILDKEPQFEVDQLSGDPAGRLDDGLPADTEMLVKSNVAEPPISLFLQRIQQQGVSVWVVASDSVLHIADLDALEGTSPIEKRMPKFLVRHKLLGTGWWAWICLLLITLLLFGFSRLLSRLFLWMLTPVVKRFDTSLQSYRLATLTDPLRILISLVAFRALMELVTPSALLRDYLIKLLIFFFTLGLAALAMRIVDLVSAQIMGRLGPSERALSYSVLPLGARIVRICIFLIAIVSILASWGYNTNAILAGLGVGGLAVALAAQKTIENLFGAISLVSDRPVLVGDFCQFGTQSGTVEDIGLRSTRIRTNDRTVVTIPNSVFSAMTIENFSRRDRIWFHPTLRFRRDTTPAKVKEMMDAITEILNNHPLVQSTELPVRLTKITDYSLEMELFTYVATADYNEFLKVQSELLLKFLEAAQASGVNWAVPVAESVTVNPPAANPIEDANFHPDETPRAGHPPPG